MSRFSFDWLEEIPPSHSATRISFFLAGFFMALWASLVPFVKSALGLDEAAFGAVLLSIGLGALVTMPYSGILIARRGAKRILAAAVPATAALLAAVALLSAAAPSTAATVALLFLFGAFFGAIDVGMNIHSVVVEARSGRKLLSGFHALYSIGGVAGAGVMTALQSAGIPGAAAASVLSALCAALWMKAGAWMLPDAGCAPDADGHSGPKFAIPKGIVLLLGAVCFIMFMVEGSILDWGALFLMEDKGAAIEHAGMGFAVFSIAMTLMRLLGDRVIMAIGPRKTVVFGAAGAAAAFALAVLSPGFWGSLAAFFLIGLGVANLVPIAFAATGEQKEMPMSLALSAATTMGYAGLLAGPAGIGALAKATSLSFAFLCEAVLLVAVAAVALFTRVFRSKA